MKVKCKSRHSVMWYFQQYVVIFAVYSTIYFENTVLCTAMTSLDCEDKLLFRMHQPWLDVTHQGICITSQEQAALGNSAWFERGFENGRKLLSTTW